MGYDPREATIDSIQHAIFSGLTTCRQATEAFLARIEAFNPQINAIISLNPEALSAAETLDREFSATGNATGALWGVPILLKDNYNAEGMPTTGGCLDLAHSRPSKDAPSVTALKKAGAIILGKANLHELALEGLTVSSLGGQTINPYDSTRTPGGSSGGSAAAVAASFAVLATGTDTVNSLRSPASANSLFSCRPTWGLISRSGVIPVSYTQDTIGPIARSVKDVATTLTVMASTAYEPSDNATALAPAEARSLDYTAQIASGTLKGLRLGLVEGFFNRTPSEETSPVNKAMQDTVNMLKEAGSTIVPLQDEMFNSSAISEQLDVQRFEFRQLLNDYLSNPELTGKHPESTEELYEGDGYVVIPAQYEYVNTALASSTSNATYANRKQQIEDFKIRLQATLVGHKLDALLYPEQQNLVVKIGARQQSGRNGILAALTGSPVVTVPVGFSPPTERAPLGVPIGMEILGRPFTEAKLLQIAYQFERQTHVRKTPKMAGESVRARRFSKVPDISPNGSNIPDAYPLGQHRES
ncbi:MAG: hypothetical protein M1831_006864 [Alyxoria varia]|nr:MAG: hypothetical protein M1831_006864 [Alyxoria varia]